MSTATTIVVAVLSGGTAGAIANQLTPWSQWAVDKRRNERERRQKIIDDARVIVGKGQGVLPNTIRSDPRFLAIRAHFTEEARLGVEGATTRPLLRIVRDEADRLAREWGL